ncbi:hypothetical protein ACU18_04420 [Arthrobacter sp. ZBG10]|uniref:hypothetical protein n=1 Tax=Micrococcaceae TaxID=1268 RepID=UPI000680670B|nr:hypothetical protein [Pseudarthrobacter sp. MEB009]KNH20399.1 hypothetical protein ACU18_04420 [Arthrobacter sp. ZBG10]KQQ94828.1 hypothetical protein ASF72_19595 [Arthrobacter sp. Leaf141]
MPILRIEHRTHDFATWKAAFDRDPAGRGKAGVQRYSIYQPVDNPRYVLIDLEFPTVSQAERLLASMRQIWSSGAAGPAFGGEPRTQILDTKEVVQLEA